MIEAWRCGANAGGGSLEHLATGMVRRNPARPVAATSMPLHPDSKVKSGLGDGPTRLSCWLN